MNNMVTSYPVEFDVDYPARPLDRLTTAFRIVVAIPIAIVLSTLSGETYNATNHSTTYVLASGGGLLFLPPLLMIVFRQKYPRWWFDWNINFLRFSNRVTAYLALLDDRYPSTDDEQAVHLNFPGALVAVIVAWFAILFTGAYPRGLFDFVVGVLRWGNRVNGYAFALVTDVYPPFRLS